jgi:hypothetical protein
MLTVIPSRTFHPIAINICVSVSGAAWSAHSFLAYQHPLILVICMIYQKKTVFPNFRRVTLSVCKAYSIIFVLEGRE